MAVFGVDKSDKIDTCPVWFEDAQI